MRVAKTLLIASAAFIATPLSAQATNEVAPADNAAVTTDANAAGTEVTTNDAALAPAPAEPVATTEPVADETPPPPADNGDGGGFPWGVLGLLGLLGLIPRLRR